MRDRYEEIIKEVLDEIAVALEDSKGIVFHQRRLAFSLSLGAVTLIEIYLEKKNVLKQGGKINHLWLKKNKENAKKLISSQITSPIENLKEIDKLSELAFEIEHKRNELAYGPLASEKILREKIDLFLEMKREVDEDAGN
jgi:hypothetical protein